MEYSQVKTQQELDPLCEQGKLKKVALRAVVPGADLPPQDVAYVPEHVADEWEQFSTTLDRCLRRDLVNQVEVTPEYREGSLVPAAIHVKAWHSGKKGSYEPSIDIW